MNSIQPLRVAFITGLSNPECWALSPEQREFVHSLGLQQADICELNFPFLACQAPYTSTPIVRASLNNAKLFLSSNMARFREKYRLSVIQFLLASERSVLLSGSSGLELLNNLHLPDKVMNRLSVFAYGPVSLRRPRFDTLLVQGKQDWISRCFYPRVDYRVNCHHMNYLQNNRVRELCIDFIKQSVDKKHSDKSLTL